MDQHRHGREGNSQEPSKHIDPKSGESRRENQKRRALEISEALRHTTTLQEKLQLQESQDEFDAMAIHKATMLSIESQQLHFEKRLAKNDSGSADEDGGSRQGAAGPASPQAQRIDSDSNTTPEESSKKAENPRQVDTSPPPSASGRARNSLSRGRTSSRTSNKSPKAADDGSFKEAHPR